MPPNKLEARGVRCIECKHLDMKERPDLAQLGSGRCLAATPVIFVGFEMARNCWPFDPLPPDVVAARDSRLHNLPPWFDRR